jgi:hypothetical protein
MQSSVRANYTRIINEMEFKLAPRRAGGASVDPIPAGWRLNMPSGPAHSYRLAQLDDYARTPRSKLEHTPPWSCSLRARVSSADLPGTWGFGLWNDPFGLSLGFGGKPGRLPVLPETAWFMHASPPNWLSLRENDTPANGFFAGAFRSSQIPSMAFAPGLLAAPFLAIKPVARSLRRLASKIIRQDQARVNTDVTLWHEYSIHWLKESCIFCLDGIETLTTACSPRPPLGLVIWIDNQYAAWTPEGRLSYGTLENPAAWMEIKALEVRRE